MNKRAREDMEDGVGNDITQLVPAKSVHDDSDPILPYDILAYMTTLDNEIWKTLRLLCKTLEYDPLVEKCYEVAKQRRDSLYYIRICGDTPCADTTEQFCLYPDFEKKYILLFIPSRYEFVIVRPKKLPVPILPGIYSGRSEDRFVPPGLWEFLYAHVFGRDDGRELVYRIARICLAGCMEQASAVVQQYAHYVIRTAEFDHAYMDPFHVSTVEFKMECPLDSWTRQIVHLHHCVLAITWRRMHADSDLDFRVNELYDMVLGECASAALAIAKKLNMKLVPGDDGAISLRSDTLTPEDAANAFIYLWNHMRTNPGVFVRSKVPIVCENYTPKEHNRLFPVYKKPRTLFEAMWNAPYKEYSFEEIKEKIWPEATEVELNQLVARRKLEWRRSHGFRVSFPGGVAQRRYFLAEDDKIFPLLSVGKPSLIPFFGGTAWFLFSKTMA